MFLIFIWMYIMNKTVIAFLIGCIVSLCTAELVITRPPKNATVLLNKRYLLHCEASGKPKPRVKWYHNDEEMPHYGINYRIRSSSGALRFKEIKVTDRGVYRCKAESGLESLYSDAAHLVVQAEVDIIDYIPDGELILDYNDNTRLTCHAAGIPQPAIQWRKNGISIIDTEEHGVTITENWNSQYVLVSVLITNNMTASSKFECEAVNQHIGGTSVKSKVFNIIVRPDSGRSIFSTLHHEWCFVVVFAILVHSILTMVTKMVM